MARVFVVAKFIPADGSDPVAVQTNVFDKLKPTPGYARHVEGRDGHDLTMEEAKAVLDAPLSMVIQPNGRWRIEGGPVRNKYARIVIEADVSGDATVARLYTAFFDRDIMP